MLLTSGIWVKGNWEHYLRLKSSVLLIVRWSLKIQGKWNRFSIFKTAVQFFICFWHKLLYPSKSEFNSCLHKFVGRFVQCGIWSAPFKKLAWSKWIWGWKSKESKFLIAENVISYWIELRIRILVFALKGDRNHIWPNGIALRLKILVFTVRK